MKKILCFLTILALSLTCIKMPSSGLNGGGNGNGNGNGGGETTVTDKLADITYQLLIYSFADSDGDGVGDFKGIQNKLDYLSSLGVSALWLSPAHPTSSYHAYDVNDYYSLNPLYAVGQKTTEKAEADFKDLLAAAHQKGIKIYMDYVLNHSGKFNPWFQEAVSDPSSKYTSPKAPYGLLVCHTVQKGSYTHLCLLKLCCLTAFQVTSSEQFSLKMGAF